MFSATNATCIKCTGDTTTDIPGDKNTGDNIKSNACNRCVNTEFYMLIAPVNTIGSEASGMCVKCPMDSFTNKAIDYTDKKMSVTDCVCSDPKAVMLVVKDEKDTTKTTASCKCRAGTFGLATKESVCTDCPNKTWSEVG